MLEGEKPINTQKNRTGTVLLVVGLLPHSSRPDYYFQRIVEFYTKFSTVIFG